MEDQVVEGKTFKKDDLVRFKGMRGEVLYGTVKCRGRFVLGHGIMYRVFGATTNPIDLFASEMEHV